MANPENVKIPKLNCHYLICLLKDADDLLHTLNLYMKKYMVESIHVRNVLELNPQDESDEYYKKYQEYSQIWLEKDRIIMSYLTEECKNENRGLRHIAYDNLKNKDK